MKTAQEPALIAEIARWRVTGVVAAFGLALGALIYVGLATDNIPLPDRPLGPDGVGFTFVTLCFLGLFALPVPYLMSAALRRGVGLYVADGCLILLAGHFRSAPLDHIKSITVGREGIFEGEPVSLSFNLPDGRALTVYTVWFKTPASEMISRLQQAGLSVPVRRLSSGSDAAPDGPA